MSMDLTRITNTEANGFHGNSLGECPVIDAKRMFKQCKGVINVLQEYNNKT